MYALLRTDNMPVRIVQLHGSAMAPTFADGQTLVVSKVTKWLDRIERGDVVAVRIPTAMLTGSWELLPSPGQSSVIIERVIGLPGDTVSIKDHGVYVNGSRIRESYVATRQQAIYRMEEYRVPKSDIFLLGDNRNDSDDSHLFQGVPKADVLGTVWLKLG
jgi:signal peptidase I